jgi:putative oxidoreductase
MGTQWNRWASISLRLVLGFGFAYHGYPKLFGGHDMFVGMLTSLGIPAPGLTAWLVGLFEFFGGLLLIVGAFVGIISILGIVNMLVAMFTFHLPNGFNFMASPPGFEVNLLYIAGFVALLLGGASRLSVDRWLAERRAIPVGSAI